jgi:hypothetical protein
VYFSVRVMLVGLPRRISGRETQKELRNTTEREIRPAEPVDAPARTVGNPEIVSEWRHPGANQTHSRQVRENFDRSDDRHRSTARGIVLRIDIVFGAADTTEREI